MIRLEIVERSGAKLYRRLVDAMRSGDLRTFQVADRGRKVTHVRHPGLLRWKESDGVITGALRGAKGENAWRLLGAFVGRIADKYADRVETLQVRFDHPKPAALVKPRRSAARRKR